MHPLLLAASLVLAGTGTTTADPAHAQAPSAPDEQTFAFVFELKGTPVGVMELSLDGPRYRYRSTQLLTRGGGSKQRTRVKELTLDSEGRFEGRTPETLALLRAPRSLGCVPTFDELTGARNEVCVTKLDSSRAEGIVGTQAFLARYARDGVLQELELPPNAIFRRHSGGKVSLVQRDVLGEGVPVTGRAKGKLRLEPPRPVRCAVPAKETSAEAARELVREVHRELQARDDALCIDFVRRYLERARTGEAIAVVGLTARQGEKRAMPHAWIRVRTAGGTLDLDPTSLAPVTDYTHVPLGCAADPGDPALGQRWLEVLFGPSTVVRRP